MHALSNYNNSGIRIATPQSDLNSSQQALNNNFIALAGVITGYVPYTGATENVDLGSNSLIFGQTCIIAASQVVPLGTGTDFATARAIIGGLIVDGYLPTIGFNKYYAPGVGDIRLFDGSAAQIILQADNTLRFEMAPSDSGGSAIDSYYESVVIAPSGNVSVGANSDDGVHQLQVYGTTSLDGGNITTDGSGNLTAANYPPPPSGDGTYTLQVTVSGGVPSYSWV